MTMPNILLIEDNPGDARLIGELLKEADNLVRSHVITHVDRVRDAVAILSRPNDIDIILSDISLPDSQGMETLTTLSEAAANLPILFMTGTNDEALAIEAMHQGAQDYLVKGHHSSGTLARAIQYAIERKRSQNDMADMQAEAKAAKQRLKLLAEQKRQLVELNRAKDEFISLASHQLRTPATAVKQYLGMVIEGHVGEVDEAIVSLLRTAYNSNERQLIVINDLLKTAQLDANRFQLKLATEDMTGLILEVLASLRPSLELKKLEIVFDATTSHYATIDRHEMRLVIENIIENACKYSPPGKTITITQKEANNCLTIVIRDQGVGISKADQKRIFDKFTRVSNELSDTVSGSGLGLYWARQIMRLHKGKITVGSEPGKGSSFTLRVPV